MKTSIFLFAAFAAIAAFAGQDEEPTPSETWNKGVAEYLAGDVTNALATIKPLTLERTHGARASELAGALEFAEARGLQQADDPAAAAERYAAAAAGFQRAAFAAEGADTPALRNLSRTIRPLEDAKAQARTRAAAKRFEGQSPDKIVAEAQRDAVKMLADYPSALEKRPADAIAAAEAMAKRAERLADVWAPLESAVAASVTNEQVAVELRKRIDGGREAARDAAAKMEDLDPSGGSALAAVEKNLFDFHTMLILPPEAIAESARATTNAFANLPQENGRNWNAVAPAFTSVFRAKFPQWLEMFEQQQSQASTNYVPLTAEAKEEIIRLAEETGNLQMSLADPSPATLTAWAGQGWEKEDVYTNVLAKIARIEGLLPKPPQDANQQQQQQQENPQQQQNPQDEPQNDERQQDDSQDEQQQPQEEQPYDDDAAEALMQRAQERNDEHEEEKKARLMNAPLSPNERDW
ncbi:MAG: hypothetical protein IJ802_05690 [Kiritimatiellae bacterium]|nr:hypothetical protein [Kiritimatiellia bacterium]